MGVLLAACPTPAAVVIQPLDVQASSTIADTDPQFVRPPETTYNGQGLLDDTVVETGDPEPATWPGHNANTGQMWLSGRHDTEPDITFDLGAECELLAVHVWNYNEAGKYTSRGAEDVAISFSTAGFGAGFGSAESFALAEALGTDAETGQTLTFARPVVARYVKIDVTNNYGDGNFTGLSEVRLIATPEPASLALLGFGGVGVLIFRRQRGA
jgi:hypothetical protein